MEKAEWEKFLDEAERVSFLQSWEWAEMLGAGFDYVRRGDRIVAGSVRLRKRILGRLSYKYWPKGPLFAKHLSQDERDALFAELLRQSDSSHSVFVRCEPSVIPGSGLSLRPSIALQPQKTQVLDLHLTADELLSAMHQKTRYNIRLAEKKGVAVSWGGPAEFEDFMRLMDETGERDAFRLHSRAHYRELLSLPWIEMAVARIGDRVLAVGLFSFYRGVATYLHGASSNADRSYMAPYALQWFAIRQSIEKQCYSYDFYGIDERKWPGVTRFKLGFGGRSVESPGTFDFALKPGLYYPYLLSRHLIRRLRRLKLR